MKFDATQRHRKNIGDKPQQGIIGAPFDWRSGQPYLERITMQPGNFAALRSRLNMQGQRDDIFPAAIPLGHLHQPERETFQRAYRHNQNQLADDEQYQRR